MEFCYLTIVLPNENLKVKPPRRPPTCGTGGESGGVPATLPAAERGGGPRRCGRARRLITQNTAHCHWPRSGAGPSLLWNDDNTVEGTSPQTVIRSKSVGMFSFQAAAQVTNDKLIVSGLCCGRVCVGVGGCVGVFALTPPNPPV